MCIFKEIDKLTLIFIWKCKGLRIRTNLDGLPTRYQDAVKLQCKIRQPKPSEG